MKMERKYPAAEITARGAKKIGGGHPWVFDNEILGITGTPEDGELVDVFGLKAKYLGTGYFNSHSKIRVRVISNNANDQFDAAFFRRRLEYAWAYRKTVMGGDLENCRLIFGEADRFPGLTVDRFGDILVTQTLSLAMERRKDLLFPLLCQVLEADGVKIAGIYERNDVKIRELEGMAQNKGFYPLGDRPLPEKTETVIRENNVEYGVDFGSGQKTGFFLDQKYNRLAAAKIAKGKTVLDCFTHTGSFALNCALGGAAHVHGVDVSESAIACARENCDRNGLQDRMSFEAANVFDLLPTLKVGAYDMIILDPPAFSKSSKTVNSAQRGYKEINFRAMKALPRGGYLATCSCSHFMTEEKFRAMLLDAASDAQVELRLVECRSQSPDHPILLTVPETDYLKFYIFQIV